MMSEKHSTLIYDELIKLVNEVRRWVKDLKTFYRKYKKETNNPSNCQQWENMKEEMIRSLRDLEEFFNSPEVLHSDVRWEIPVDVLRYLDSGESIEKYFED
jgi:hypothetical protein